MGLEDRLQRLEDGAPEEEEACETCCSRPPMYIVWEGGEDHGKTPPPDKCPDCSAAWEYDDIEVTWEDA
jgi:hypothetical protein